MMLNEHIAECRNLPERGMEGFNEEMTLEQSPETRVGICQIEHLRWVEGAEKAL